MPMSEFSPLFLRRNEERRIRAGHPWVFSNEIDMAKSSVKDLMPGQWVEVFDYRGVSIGTGYANPSSLITARIVSRDKAHPLSASLLVHRLNVALALRERLYTEPYYRLAYGESDGLPGLVIDRFDKIVVVQITTAGMQAMKEAVLEAIDKVVHPQTIYLRNDNAMRELEGLGMESEVIGQPLPESIELLEAGCRFEVPLLSGQKTGWFYDQRDNREGLPRLVKGARVLDVFSYVGGWGIRAAAAGAAEVVCVDESQTALGYVARNASLNGVENKVSTVCADAFVALKEMRAEREHFDVVIVDPPAFIKRRKDAKQGVEAYRRINQMAMQLMSKDGILISCSCSHHLQEGVLDEQLYLAARHVDRQLQLLWRGGQSADHPVHPAVPESAYLKALFTRVYRG